MAYVIVILTAGLGGFALVESSSSYMIDAQRENVLSSNAYAGQMFVALWERDRGGTQHPKELQDQIAGISDTGGTERPSICLLEETAGYDESSFVNSLVTGQQGYAFLGKNGATKLQVVFRIDLSNSPYYIETLSDFTEAFARRDRLIALYRFAVLTIAVFSGVVLLIFSFFIAHPLNRLSHAVNRMTAGDYSKRIPTHKHGTGSAEIHQLSVGFNTMANAVEETISQLKEEVEKREMFVADFAHELKTPMTSIIGYADMLRSYDLNVEEHREAAHAIYQEGKRLEKLSMALLDMIVLNNEPVSLVPLSSGELAHNLRTSLRFLSEKYGVEIQLQMESALIRGEPVLLLSLLYNLTDNACKASGAGDAVLLSGAVRHGCYLLSITDHGHGISKEHLDKITEPFYREDKSRSRKLGGAGLGLALCRRIAHLHHTDLFFDSIPGQGTVVTFELETTEGVAGP